MGKSSAKEKASRQQVAAAIDARMIGRPLLRRSNLIWVATLKLRSRQPASLADGRRRVSNRRPALGALG
jgi:hypothetical protein